MHNFSKTKIRTGSRLFLYLFACIGFIFVVVFFGVRFGWLNVKGSIAQRNSYFNLGNVTKKALASDDLTITCQINVLSKQAPLTAINISKALSSGTDKTVLAEMVRIARERFNSSPLFNLSMEQCNYTIEDSLNLPQSAYYWADTEEWNLMKHVFTRDQDIIKRAAFDSGVQPRALLGAVIGEQFRFLTNRRETFKSYFEPMKILASLSNTSYGIAGLKPKTVEQIEANIKNSHSPFYLGDEFSHIVDYTDPLNTESERMDRITDAKNPYYSYLYVGLFMKEIMAQWEKAGYPLINRPDVLATLYNLGFYYSQPKQNPIAGGTVIHINNMDYTFGELAYEFYYSGELGDVFPLGVQYQYE